MRTSRRLLLGYVATSLLLVAGGAAFILLRPEDVGLLHRAGRASSETLSVGAFALGWAFVGAVLLVAQRRDVVRAHGIFLGVLVVAGFGFLNLVREPHPAGFGDFQNYFDAARSMHRGEPLADVPGRLYRYPPLLASLLSPFVGVGLERLSQAYHFLDWIALVILFTLLYRSLLLFRFSREAAALAILVLAVANVPVARSIVYHQINIPVMDLVLASLLVCATHPVLSAASLAMATQLKVSPALLVLPFVVERRWRWLGAYAAANVALVALTSWLTSPRYYYDLVQRVGGIIETGLTNNSIDSFVLNTLTIFSPGLLAWSHGLSVVLRAALALWAFAAIVPLARRPLFTDATGWERTVRNGYVLLPVVMVLVAPTVWEHHFVWWMLTMPVLASAVTATPEALLVAGAWICVFLVPVVSAYPVSYLRLAGVLAVVRLLHQLARQPRGRKGAAWFEAMKARLVTHAPSRTASAA